MTNRSGADKLIIHHAHGCNNGDRTQEGKRSLFIGHWALATGDETDCDRTSAQPIAADGIR
nr:hypothetical protein [Nostoc sp. DedQUE02]